MNYIKSNTLFEHIPTEELFESIPHPIVLGDELQSPENMGAMIRLSNNIGASEMCFLGEVPANIGKVRRSAASSRDNIKWYFTNETDLRKIVPANKTLVAIETAQNATNIYETDLPKDIAFVVGNESKGMREAILNQCDMVVYIPVPGTNKSLNVSHAAVVAVFEWQRQMLARLANDTHEDL